MKDIKLIITSVIFVILLAIISTFIFKDTHPVAENDIHGSWACTADAKECPDGSYVGRVPPYCLFAACPGE